MPKGRTALHEGPEEDCGHGTPERASPDPEPPAAPRTRPPRARPPGSPPRPPALPRCPLVHVGSPLPVERVTIKSPSTSRAPGPASGRSPNAIWQTLRAMALLRMASVITTARVVFPPRDGASPAGGWPEPGRPRPLHRIRRCPAAGDHAAVEPPPSPKAFTATAAATVDPVRDGQAHETEAPSSRSPGRALADCGPRARPDAPHRRLIPAGPSEAEASASTRLGTGRAAGSPNPRSRGSQWAPAARGRPRLEAVSRAASHSTTDRPRTARRRCPRPGRRRAPGWKCADPH